MPTRTKNKTARGRLYGLVGALLSAPPDDEALRDLAGMKTLAGKGAVADNLRALAEIAAEVSAVAVEEEFQEFFIGLGKGRIVPFGSWYQTGFLMEKPLARLRRDLAALGIERRPGVFEPEDHAGALCEAMAFLSAADDEKTHQQQKDFFEAHLAAWIENFFADLAAEQGRFYPAVGELGAAFVAFEREYFAMPA